MSEGSHQFRCEHAMHGIMITEDVIEFKCKSKFCGAKSGVVVLHQFDIHSGDLVDTKIFRDAPSMKETVK